MRKTSRRRAVVFVGLAATLGLALGNVRAAAPKTLAGRGREVLVNRQPEKVRQHYDQTLAVNPKNPNNYVVTSSQTVDSTCFIHSSFNGGKSWKTNQIELLEGAKTCGITSTAFAKDGTLYVAYNATEADDVRRLVIARSSNGGRSFDLHESTGLKSSYATGVGVDNSGGPRDGTVYVAYIASGGPPDRVTKVISSTDRAKSFSSPTTLSKINEQVVGRIQLEMGPKGEVYVAYMDFTEAFPVIAAFFVGAGADDSPDAAPFSIHVAASQDGETFTSTEVDNQVGPGLIANVQTVIPFPVVAADARDGKKVHLVVTDRRRGGDWDLYYYNSTDGGITWSDPQRLTDDPCEPRRDQVMPWIEFAPNGRLDVVWLDRREDEDNVFGRPYITSSFDGGKTWTPNRPLSKKTFNMGIGSQGFGQSTYLGDRLALHSTNSGGFLVWPDTRSGTDVTGTHDLYARNLMVSKPAKTKELSEC
jgi:hypothetical protein